MTSNNFLKSAQSKRRGGALESVKTIVWAGLIAVAIRTLLFEPFNIPSGSMIPTLLIGDFLFVSKSAYGYSRYSLPFGSHLPAGGRFWAAEPQRGEVIVFRPPGEPQTDFIKRLIGLPGDRIQMIGGVLHINGAPVKRERIADYVDPENPYAAPAPQYLETLPGGVTHRVLELAGDRGRFDDTPVYVVPPGHYFMMGDNRDNSNDSREPAFSTTVGLDDEIGQPEQLGKVGFVPFENLVGPAKILFWSSDSSFRWTDPRTWVTAARWSRIGTFVE